MSTVHVRQGPQRNRFDLNTENGWVGQVVRHETWPWRRWELRIPGRDNTRHVSRRRAVHAAQQWVDSRA